ncbi:MAG: ATP-grasp fold amidoligase family protein [Bacillota bacterium]
MNYKKIIPSQKLRLKLLKFGDAIPDKLMIKLQYRLATGRRLNLKKPESFPEKLQWYKLYYRDPLITKCSDKYRVREYLKSKGLEDILVPLYGVYENAEDIDFNKLPDKFVIKTTNGSKTNILCEDKSQLDIEHTKKTLNRWLNEWNGKIGREWGYYNVKPLIICEKYLEKDGNNDLVDYKFFCFDGIPSYLYVIVERFLQGGAKLGIYDMKFEKVPYRRIDIPHFTGNIEKPENYNKMIDIAKKLSEDFPHARVDLYNIDGKIYFGELTFYNGSGYKDHIPEQLDLILGEKFRLPKKFI